MKTKTNLIKTSVYDPSWIIELLKKQHPERADIIRAMKDCTTCRWESPAYAYFNEGLQLNGGAMLHDPVKGLIIIDMTECGKVAGIEFVNETEGPANEPLCKDTGTWKMTGIVSENPEDFKTSFTPAGFPLWKNDKCSQRSPLIPKGKPPRN